MSPAGLTPWAQEAYRLSERHASRLIRLPRSTIHLLVRSADGNDASISELDGNPEAAAMEIATFLRLHVGAYSNCEDFWIKNMICLSSEERVSKAVILVGAQSICLYTGAIEMPVADTPRTRTLH